MFKAQAQEAAVRVVDLLREMEYEVALDEDESCVLKDVIAKAIQGVEDEG